MTAARTMVEMPAAISMVSLMKPWYLRTGLSYIKQTEIPEINSSFPFQIAPSSRHPAFGRRDGFRRGSDLRRLRLSRRSRFAAVAAHRKRHLVCARALGDIENPHHVAEDHSGVAVEHHRLVGFVREFVLERRSEFGFGELLRVEENLMRRGIGHGGSFLRLIHRGRLHLR